MTDTDALLLKSDSDDPSTSTTNVYDVGGDRKKKKRRRSSLASMINVFTKRPSKNNDNINSKSMNSGGGSVEQIIDASANTTATTPFIFSSTGVVLQDNITPAPSLILPAASAAADESSGDILVTMVPNLNNLSMDVLQIILNNHLSEVYPQNYTAFELTHMKGDRAVAYLYYVHFMIVHGVDRNQYVFQNLCNIMRYMYMQWSDQIKHLYPLVVNLNGADPTKEIMNIVNQSVYSVIRFVFNNVLRLRVNDYFADLKQHSTFDATTHPESFFTSYSDQQQLMGMFNVAINQLQPTQHKHYSYEQITDNVNLSEFKLKHAPISHIVHVPFQIFKHHSSVYESEA
ncbi:hypothetical protein [Psilogramma increta granulovirus]|uniref:Uncharacterized protein n=1 Tax=Psilogramma increta granulovirus TaxID=2953508 RepID=A0A977TNZ4_9BBAC|nr:hypothetical protein [Psilogramma increta granulovirus]